MDISATEYVSAGYYITRLSEKHSRDSIPDKVISASGCICDFFPDAWAMEWVTDGSEKRSKQAAAFGIAESDLPAVVKWATQSFSKTFGWPNVFYTLAAAEEARGKFLPGNHEIVIFGVSLHNSDRDKFLEYAQPQVNRPEFSPIGPTGIFECVSRRTKPSGGGEVWGFELLANCSGLLTCSWLCNMLQKDCEEQLGITTNRFGLLSSYADASRCAEFISRPEVGAEPGLWLPWLVTVYSLPTL